MNPSPVTKKVLFFSFFISVLIIAVQIVIAVFDNKTKIVFCDVGQGDAAYIRVKNKVDVVIDAGPDRKVLNCLGKYMPFYDRTIELAILSHDQKDHFGGYEYLADRYSIKTIFVSPMKSSNQSYLKLLGKLMDKKVSIKTVSVGMNLKILGGFFLFFWPPEPFAKLSTSSNDNDYSLVFSFEENGFKALFTGDASSKVLDEIQKQVRDDIGGVDILKIPHHGSKNGLTKKFLQSANPAVAVISVGKKNSYGHPTKEILEMLAAVKVKVRRTDWEGDIVFRINQKRSEVGKNRKTR